jgi:membrane associated rhomboid family serine protease
MLLPIGDDNSDRTIAPVLNYLILAANILVFVVFQGLGANERFTYAFSTVPIEIVTGRDLRGPVVVRDAEGQEVGTINHQPTPLSVYVTLLTSMFMHGSIAHIFGNMLYLWIFGDNLENAMGRGRYLGFYLLTGIIASLSHVFTTVAFHGNAAIPSLGASGAISGILGGYLILFPRRRVRVLMMRMITDVPAIFAIGLWFLFQILMSAVDQAGGVAYGAHLGGFLAGMILVKFFTPASAGRASR